MKTIFAHLYLAVSLLVCGLLFAGCKAASPAASQISNASIVSITVSGPTTVTPGSPITLTGTAHLSDGTTQGNPQDLMEAFTATWSTSDSTKETVTNTTTSSSTSITTQVAAVAGQTGSAMIQVTFMAGGGTFVSAPFTVTITGVSTSCTGTPTGSEAALNGHYAILMHGFSGAGIGTAQALVASFSANGSGTIAANGEEDLNNATAPQHLTITGGTYTIGSDLRGCVQLTYSGGTIATAVFHFALGGVSGVIASKGDIIEFDDTTGSGSRASGILRLQTASAFALNQLAATYAFGLDGIDSVNAHIAIAGVLNVNTATGAITGGTFDNDDAGVPSGNVSITTTSTLAITATTATTGRTILTFIAAGNTAHEATYIVNATELFEVQIDAFGVNGPILSGRAIAAVGPFSAASLAGTQIIHLTGAVSGVSNVNLGLLTFTTAGTALSGSFYEYASGSGASTKTITAQTYAVTASGRTTFSNYAGNPIPILYLAAANSENISAFVVGTDTHALFGYLEFQSSTTNGSASVNGIYFFGSEDPADNNAPNTIAGGTVAFVAGSGTVSRDSSLTSGLSTNQSLTFSLSIPNGALGTGSTGAVSLDAVTNGSKVFTVQISSGNTAEIRTLEK